MPDNPSGQLPSDHGIGQLRWQVSLYRRDQSPAIEDSGISENFVLLATVHADVQPTYPTTYYNSAQIDIPITHLVRVRWLDYVETVHVIRRATFRPTDGSFRTELFRVRRVKEVGGRKRFTELEVELERALTTLTDSDEEFQQLFAENPVVN